MNHNLKTLPEYFEAVRDGFKTFEVRKNDRNYKVHDNLLLNEWSPEKGYTSNVVEAKVLYILSDTEYVKEGFVILGIEVFE